MNDIHEYAKLSPWQPSELAGFKVGMLANCPNLGRVEIVELLPPSLLRVRTQSGGIAKVGWRAIEKVGAVQSKVQTP